MAISLQQTRSDVRSATERAKALAGSLARFGAVTLAPVKSGLRTIQTARMMSVLARLNDRQLAEIGITRAEIPHYAERLVSKDWDDT